MDLAGLKPHTVLVERLVSPQVPDFDPPAWCMVQVFYFWAPVSIRRGHVVPGPVDCHGPAGLPVPQQLGRRLLSSRGSVCTALYVLHDTILRNCSARHCTALLTFMLRGPHSDGALTVSQHKDCTGGVLTHRLRGSVQRKVQFEPAACSIKYDLQR